MRVVLLLSLFCIPSLFSELNAQWGKGFYLVDTAKFHQLSASERTMLDTSLEQVHEVENDSARITLLYEMFMKMSDNDVWIEYNDLILSAVEDSSFRNRYPGFSKKTILDCIINKAYYQNYKGKTDRALREYKKALEMSRKFGFQSAEAGLLNNLGHLMNEVGGRAMAMKYYRKSLAISEKLGDPRGVSLTLNNIGDLFLYQGEYALARKHLLKGLKIAKSGGVDRWKGKLYFNIAKTYENEGEYELARAYFDSAEVVLENVNDRVGLATLKVTLGFFKFQKGQTDSGFYFYHEGIAINKGIGNFKGLIRNYDKLGKAHLKWGDLDSSLYYLQKSHQWAEQLESPIYLKNSSKGLYRYYKRKKDYEDALKYHEIYSSNKDSLFNEESQKNVLKEQFLYENDKRRLADSLEFAKKEEMKDLALKKQKAQLKQEQTQRYALYGGLGLTLAIAFLIYRGLQQKKKDHQVISQQKAEVEQQRDEADEQRNIAQEQKAIVEEQNKEILASIAYAKRLQEAILPPVRLVEEWLPRSFIFYQPKDIVAGDFYWMENVGDTVYFAAADCTGHGVPGAIVSVICSQVLSKALLEENIKEPERILDRVRELVIERFERSQEEVKDGMDISLCAWNHETRELKWAGANNPLWIVGGDHLESTASKIYRPDKERDQAGVDSDLPLYEFKPDKQPIGKFDSMTSFTGYSLQLEAGDTIYVFSDGFIDQFGGPKKKKYKSLPFKRFLYSLQKHSMKEQQNLLEKEFRSWKGEMQQIDDVCVIGVRV